MPKAALEANASLLVSLVWKRGGAAEEAEMFQKGKMSVLEEDLLKFIGGESAKS
jgi:hypothetical protein